MEDVTTFFDENDFAVVATINNGEVLGILSQDWVEIDTPMSLLQGSKNYVSGVATGFKPVFDCATADVVSVEIGDTAVIGGVTYTIVYPQPDGTGMTRLVLRT